MKNTTKLKNQLCNRADCIYSFVEPPSVPPLALCCARLRCAVLLAGALLCWCTSNMEQHVFPWQDSLRAPGHRVLLHAPDCSLGQGARPLKGTYKGDLFTYVFVFLYFWYLFRLLGLKNMFFELLHANSFIIIFKFN